MNKTEARRHNHAQGLCEKIRQKYEADRVSILTSHNGVVDSEGQCFLYFSTQFVSAGEKVESFWRENQKIPAMIYASISMSAMTKMRGVVLNVDEVKNTILGSLLYNEGVSTTVFVGIMREKSVDPELHALLRIDYSNPTDVQIKAPMKIFKEYYEDFERYMFNYVAE